MHPFVLAFNVSHFLRKTFLDSLFVYEALFAHSVNSFFEGWVVEGWGGARLLLLCLISESDSGCVIYFSTRAKSRLVGRPLLRSWGHWGQA